jgi:hypothetical protein
MKALVLGVIAGLILIIFALGCDRRHIDVPSEPALVSANDAKRVLAFSFVTTISGTDYYKVSLHDTGGYQAVHEGTRNSIYDLVNVTIGGITVPLIYHDYGYSGEGWWSDVNYSISGEQPITLKINNDTVLNSHIDAIHTASVAFPAAYNYLQPLTLNWAVEAQNRYQFVRLESGIFTAGQWYLSDSYIKQIQASQCSFTFPANCVSLCYQPELTEFYLCVEEVDYKIVGKTAVMVYQEEGNIYNADTKNNRQRLGKRILDIYRALSD